MAILLLVAELVKRQIFSGFEFEVLDGFFEFGHGLGPVSDGQSYHKKNAHLIHGGRPEGTALERTTGFEPVTISLEGWSSTS